MNGVRRTIGVGAALALFVVGVAVAGPAGAAHVSCGQTITVSTVLDSDVGPCARGLTIGADNVIFDLNGFRVFGTPNQGDLSGIQALNRTGVVIRNGTVTGFDNGVYLEGGSRNTITNMDVRDNIGPLNNTGIFSEGIQLFRSDENTISNNRVVHNGPGAGIFVYNSQRNLITSNQVANNNVLTENQPGHGVLMQDIGIALINIGRATTGNVVANNQVTGNGLDGIQIARLTDNNIVRHNQVSNNGFGQIGNNRVGDGIAIFGRNNLVEENVAYQNANAGIHAYSHPTNAALRATGNTIQRNRAFGNVRFDLADENPNCDANVWQANQFGTRNQACIQ